MGPLATAALLLIPVPGPVLDGLLLGNLLLAAALLLSVAAVSSAQEGALRGLQPLALALLHGRWRGGRQALRALSPLLRAPRFPALLTLAVLLRLALTVAAVRLLLTSGDAGWVVAQAGELAGQDPRTALAVLLLLGIAQYLVLARGGERTAEVAARFALEALPGRQAAVDAELRGGTLSALEARTQRERLIEEAQRYGAMDGALRLLRGDVVAGLLALGIALLFATWLGATSGGLDLGAAWSQATAQVAGLGLCTQVPVLLTSAAALLLLSAGQPGTARPGRRRGQPVLLRGPAEQWGLDEVQDQLDVLARQRPALVRETLPRRCSLPLLAATLRELLAEGVAPLPLADVLEALAALPAAAGEGTAAATLAELLRSQLGRTLLRIARQRAAAATLPALIVDAELAELLSDSLRGAAGQQGQQILALDMDLQAELRAQVAQGQAAAPGAVVLCPAALRRPLQRLLAAARDGAAEEALVLAYGELPAEAAINTCGRLTPGGFRGGWS